MKVKKKHVILNWKVKFLENVDIKFSTYDAFCNNLHQKIGKLNNLNVCGRKKSKGLKQEIENRVWSPMSEGGEH
jgi:hypothetical protein